MSVFSEKVLAMTPREIEDAEWVVVHRALLDAKKHFSENGLGNQSWLDGSIGIAESRSRSDQPSEHPKPFMIGQRVIYGGVICTVCKPENENLTDWPWIVWARIDSMPKGVHSLPNDSILTVGIVEVI